MVAIIPNTPICIDSFYPNEGVRIFFLTHMHTDHLAGLNNSWRGGCIYMSNTSRLLLIDRFPGINSADIIALPVDDTSLICVDGCHHEMISVTLVDANHCPGAVMFIFHGYFGCVIHTGDFRFDRSFESHSAVFHPDRPLKVDLLYLDNTYCDPACMFPSRNEATCEVIRLIRNYNDSTLVYIAMDILGKEELLVELALELKTRIYLPPNRMTIARSLGLRDVFTDDALSTRIRVEMKRLVTRERLEVISLEVGVPVLGIFPTGLFTTIGGSKFDKDVDIITANTPSTMPLSVGGSTMRLELGSYYNNNVYMHLKSDVLQDESNENLIPSVSMHVVQYSLHSSYSELRDFMACILAVDVFPIVKDLNCDSVLLKSLGGHADVSSRLHFTIPPTVRDFMFIDGPSYLKDVSKLRHKDFRNDLRQLIDTNTRVSIENTIVKQCASQSTCSLVSSASDCPTVISSSLSKPSLSFPLKSRKRPIVRSATSTVPPVKTEVKSSFRLLPWKRKRLPSTVVTIKQDRNVLPEESSAQNISWARHFVLESIMRYC